MYNVHRPQDRGSKRDKDRMEERKKFKKKKTKLQQFEVVQLFKHTMNNS